MSVLGILILLLASYVKDAAGFPGGAPASACINVYPHHTQTHPQNSTPPYAIYVNQASYQPGDVLEVTLSAEPGWTLLGFVLVAQRETGDREELLGEFTDLPALTENKTWPPDAQNQASCVTHSELAPRSEVKLRWKAPAGYLLGNIIFRAGAVHNYSTFWVDVQSDVIFAVKQWPDPPRHAMIGASDSLLNATDECGATKGCVLYPRTCVRGSCTHVLTFTPVPQGMTFELRVTGHEYISVGFSKDQLMGDDETVTCLLSGDFVDVQHGFNPAKYNVQYRRTGFQDIEAYRDDDVLYCRWTQPVFNAFVYLDDFSIAAPQSREVSFNLTEELYVMLASGHVDVERGVLERHVELPLVSVHKADLTAAQVVHLTSMPAYVQIHVVLMAVAWMLLAPCVPLVARHFKEGRLSRVVCGMPQWMQLHQGLAVVAWLMTVLAFMLIFLVLRGFTQRAVAHGVLGVVVTVLLSVQIFAGMFRPDLEHPLRPAFRWAHRIAGFLLIVLAGVTLVLGTVNAALQPAQAAALFWTFIAWLVLQLLWIASFELLSCCCADSAEPGEKAPEPLGWQSVCRTALILGFVLSNAVLTLIAVALVFIF